MPARTSRPPLLLGWTLFSLALVAAPVVASADDKAAPPKSGSTASGNSVTEGFRSLGQQISDPKTLDRIKGHEQEFEKNVKTTRDQQRQNHPGELRATDATDMATDPKMGGRGKTAAKTTTTAPKAAPAPKHATPGKSESTASATTTAPPKAPPPAAAPAR